MNSFSACAQRSVHACCQCRLRTLTEGVAVSLTPYRTVFQARCLLDLIEALDLSFRPVARVYLLGSCVFFLPKRHDQSHGSTCFCRTRTDADS
eukprot:m.661098 g.661098  ORF g.661098 m.661098 type:complete len:93 (-) comp58461_c2_seq1:238-516(-)